MPLVVLRGILAENEQDSVVRSNAQLSILGARMSKYRVMLRDDSFEASLLGHSGVQIAPGPLMVAALGWEPPERSTNFYLSLLSTDGNSLSSPIPPSIDEFRVLESELAKLNTRLMTALVGERLDHALVWEKRVEFLTKDPSAAMEMGLKAALPEGDFENDLRRLIDDSTNILSELDFNKKRIDAGQSPINLAWPWGQGESVRVTNRALALGYPWNVFSPSLNLRGMARLSGFRPKKISSLDNLNVKSMKLLFEQVKKEPNTISDIDFSVLPAEALEERAYRLDEILRYLVIPIADEIDVRKGRMGILLTDPNNSGILGISPISNPYPLDERSMTERAVPVMEYQQVIDSLT